MPFDWMRFLELAEYLGSRPDEASQRSAMSRCYYSVFNVAFKRAEDNVGRCPVHAGKHAWCWNRYLTTPDHTCRRLAIEGDRMKAKRVRADYNAADYPRLADEVQRMLADARQFHVDLANLPIRYPL